MRRSNEYASWERACSRAVAGSAARRWRECARVLLHAHARAQFPRRPLASAQAERRGDSLRDRRRLGGRASRRAGVSVSPEARVAAGGVAPLTPSLTVPLAATLAALSLQLLRGAPELRRQSGLHGLASRIRDGRWGRGSHLELTAPPTRTPNPAVVSLAPRACDDASRCVGAAWTNPRDRPGAIPRVRLSRLWRKGRVRRGIPTKEQTRTQAAAHRYKTLTRVAAVLTAKRIG